ncbi:MAG: hypothetical protein Q7S18_02815 [bacterium]|nr:hypothetical protein [bacterium]
MINTLSKAKKKRREAIKKGSALVYALVMMAAVMIILVSMLGYISSQLKFSFNRVEREKSFQISEAGVYYYRWYLAHETSGKTAQELAAFWQEPSTLGVGSPYEADYEGIGKYKIEVTASSSGSTIVIVKSTGWTYKSPEVKRIVEVRFRRPSWSEYVFLSNDFINFGNQAEVYGKVFSNGGIRFDGIAHNTVSSLLPSFNDPTWGGNRMEFGVHTTVNPADPDAPDYPWPPGAVPDRPDIFIGGRNFPVPQVSFTGVTTDLGNMKSEAQSGKGKYFDGSGLGRRIIFKSDGTYDVCTVNTANSSTHTISRYLKTSGSGTCNTCDGACLNNYPIVDNGVIFVENSAWVDGAINNKRITVAAAKLSGGGTDADIYIGTSNSNLRYAAYDCDNILGLVAQRDIRVLGSCPDDYIVDAALLAQNGTVGINDNGFSGKNSLTFNGAIASYLQPYFQHGNSGFAVRFYNFDNNLLYCPPPYFPTGTEYSIDLWEEL